MGSSFGLDRDAFRQLFEEHREPIFRYLVRLSGNRHDAEDLLQETFARYWRKQEQFRGEGSIGGYLRRIAYRTFLNARSNLSRARSAAPLESVEPTLGERGPAARAEKRDWEAHLLSAVRKVVLDLPDSWRDAFILFRYEGHTMKEIASQLDITPKAVEARLARALRAVRAGLGDVVQDRDDRASRGDDASRPSASPKNRGTGGVV